LLKQRLIKGAEKQITGEMLNKTLKIDMELPLPAVSLNLWEEIKKLQPFGLGNPEPSFSSKAMVKSFRTVGSDSKHLKLSLALITNCSIANCFSAIAFNMGNLAEKLEIDQKVEIAYNLSLNIWNNTQNIELKIKDIKWPNSKT